MEREGLARLARERKARAAAAAAVERAPGACGPAERIAAVVDEGSFFEISALATSQLPGLRADTPSDGVTAGFGRVGGREVAIIADDPVIIRRSDGSVGRNKRLRLLMHALHGRVPVLYIADGGGYQQAALDLSEGRLLGRYSDRSVVVPEMELTERQAPIVSVLLGPCAGQEAALVVASDVLISIPGASISAQPAADAGPAPADLVVEDEARALAAAKAILALLPEQRTAPLACVAPAAPAREFGTTTGAELTSRDILAGLLDAGSQVAWDPGAPSPLHLGLGRVKGVPVAYALGDDSAGLAEPELERLRRVAALANRLALPLLLVQHGAAYDDAAAGRGAFVRSLAETIATLHDGDAILLSLVTRRGHALGDFVLGGRELGTACVLAWPAADIGIDDIPAFTSAEAARVAGRGPWDAAGLAVVDDIIEPGETRDRIAALLALLVRSRDYPKAHTERSGRIPYR
ncbi:MAG: hypothetical protein IT303_19510 [Dehalococcoidia bacterium]|nr:hypothetical protein [Dehalococcoidia bacterium]